MNQRAEGVWQGRGGGLCGFVYVALHIRHHQKGGGRGLAGNAQLLEISLWLGAGRTAGCEDSWPATCAAKGGCSSGLQRRHASGRAVLVVALVLVALALRVLLQPVDEGLGGLAHARARLSRHLQHCARVRLVRPAVRVGVVCGWGGGGAVRLAGWGCADRGLGRRALIANPACGPPSTHHLGTPPHSHPQQRTRPG